MKLNAKMLLTALTILLLVATLSTSVFATTSIINDIKSQAETTNSIDSAEMTATAGKVLKLIRTIAIILGTIVIAVLGVKYMMGSVEEKAEYKKTMGYYILGAILLFGGSTIPNVLYKIGTSINRGV